MTKHIIMLVTSSTQLCFGITKFKTVAWHFALDLYHSESQTSTHDWEVWK